MRDGCIQVVVVNEGDLNDERILPSGFPRTNTPQGICFYVTLCTVVTSCLLVQLIYNSPRVLNCRSFATQVSRDRLTFRDGLHLNFSHNSTQTVNNLPTALLSRSCLRSRLISYD